MDWYLELVLNNIFLEFFLFGYYYVFLRYKIKNCIILEFILCENMVFSNLKFIFNFNNM